MNNKRKKNISALPLDILFEEVFKQLHAPLFFYALKFVDNHEVAKDLVQDAFFSILDSSNNTEIENLKSYLYHSVRNNCLNFLKHKEIKSQYIKEENVLVFKNERFHDLAVKLKRWYNVEIVINDDDKKTRDIPELLKRKHWNRQLKH